MNKIKKSGTNIKGISPTFLEEWGRRGISTGGFPLEDAIIHDKYLNYAMEGFDLARALIAVVSSNGAQAALSEAIAYIIMRKAFGQPIGKFEGVQFKIAGNWRNLKRQSCLVIKLSGFR